MTSLQLVRQRFERLGPVMDERVRRLWAASEALDAGYGGISLVSEATGLSRVTITAGIQEIQSGAGALPESETGQARIRRPGAGRKPLADSDSGLLAALETLVDSTTRGDPMSPLRWTCKSVRNLSEELIEQGHMASERTVRRLLHDQHFSLQSNRKTEEGADHPDRNAQFEYISKLVRRFQKRSQPVISVDTKKKEVIGNYKNAGREWAPKGKAKKVNSHDFPDKELGKAVPYGVYDVNENTGWVNVGNDHDTAEFAIESIRRWWQKIGSPTYPSATELLITADAGGSNSYRNRLWKVCLQQLANDTGLKISVCHFPPGTSKWNKIEHRMFCHITQNWRGEPLTSLEVVVQLIGHTSTRKGLTIKAGLDNGKYKKGIKISDKELQKLNLKRATFHGDWNYTIFKLAEMP